MNQKIKQDKKQGVFNQQKKMSHIILTINNSSILGDEQNKTVNLNSSLDMNDEHTNEQGNVDAKWCELKILGKNISRRRNHTAVIFYGCMYIYGGYEINAGILDDFYCMEIQDANVYRWQVIHSGEKPEYYPGKRANHSAIVFQNEMFIFGGLTNTLQNTNEMFAFNFETSEWRKVDQGGNIPSPIDSHSAAIDGNIMVVFGGFMNEKNGGYSNQVFTYNFLTNIWEVLQSQNQIQPPQRTCGSICILNNSLYLFGGTNCEKKFDDFWQYNLKSLEWKQIVASGQIPESRNGHSLINYYGVIILFGGIHDITHEKNDMLTFNVQKQEWQIIDVDTSHKKDDNNDMPYSPPSQKQNDGDVKGITQSNTFNIQPDVYNTKHHNSKKRQYIPFQKIDETKQFEKQNQNKIINVSSTNQIEENRKKRNQLKKNNLLQEFELKNEEEKEKYKPNSPTTEGLKNKIMSIGNPLKKKKYMYQYLDSTKYSNKNNYNYKSNRIIGHRPCARDGHSAAVFENQFLIFGGDRHLMAYNDLYMVDLQEITGIQAPFQQNQKHKKITNYQLNDDNLQENKLEEDQNIDPNQEQENLQLQQQQQ